MDAEGRFDSPRRVHKGAVVDGNVGPVSREFGAIRPTIDRLSRAFVLLAVALALCGEVSACAAGRAMTTPPRSIPHLLGVVLALDPAMYVNAKLAA
jgi:hypothetical protein